MVLLIHTSMYGRNEYPELFNTIIANGARGVQLFFLISAFTLFLSFKIRASEENSIKNFYARRFFRIAPMYYLGIVYYIFQNYHASNTNFTFIQIASNITFTHGFLPYSINSVVPGGWSIAVEMMFYAILPFLFLKIKKLNQAFIFFIGSLVLMVGLKYLFLEYGSPENKFVLQEFLFMYLPNQLPIFALGIILYFVIIENGKNISIISLLALLMMIIIDLFSGRQIFFANHILFGIGFFILAYLFSKIPSKLFHNAIVNHIGKISFSMYLVHFAVLYWMYHFGFIDFTENGILNYFVRYSIMAIITILISSITYRWIELGFQKWGNKLIKMN